MFSAVYRCVTILRQKLLQKPIAVAQMLLLVRSISSRCGKALSVLYVWALGAVRLGYNVFIVYFSCFIDLYVMNPKVDWFFEKESKWQELYAELRLLVLDSGLSEELKWGCPCYVYEAKNVVLIHGFKDYCALLFHKGVLLQDKQGMLIQQTEQVQAARQLRFSSLQEVVQHKAMVKAYLKEAIAVEQAGLTVPLKKTNEYAVPIEWQRLIDEMPELKRAFEALTPGRQFALFFGSQTVEDSRSPNC
jgi:uncharacterized protein YdeI (YjbR/CyaY-like superfamily)